MGVFLLGLLDSTGIPMVGGVDLYIVLVAMVDRSQGYLAAAAAIAGSLIGSLIAVSDRAQGRRRVSSPAHLQPSRR
jgi:hypothetical protein